jgi:DNA repair protein RadC
MNGHWRRLGERDRQKADAWQREMCWLWFVGHDHQVLGSLILRGGMSTIALPLGSIARALVRLNAAYLFMAHSHPSGDMRPSDQDVAATRQIWRTARAVGASLQDHYIFGHHSDCFSFREHGLL